MRPTRQLMVGLDLTLLDSILISYAGFLTRQLVPEKILFVTVIPEEVFPSSFKSALRVVEDEMLELTKEEIQEKIEEHFPRDLDVDVEIQVVKGSPMDKLVGLAYERHIDILILGRKKELKGSGVLANGILRYVNCSVLLVPEMVKRRLSNILLCNDFSAFSKRAMDAAMRMAYSNPEEISIYSQHVIPVETATDGSVNEEDHAMHEALREVAMNQYNAFIDQFELGDIHVTPVFSLNKEHTIAETIHRTARQKQADLVVIGSRGRSLSTPFMMGSLTEKLSKKMSNIPLLVIKGQGNMPEDWSYKDAVALKTD